tara:strand:- start:709 stop:1395 length:687 start_codon:yes stop_codon:yes gene_type:complete
VRLDQNQKKLCEEIKYSFVNADLLEQALVHSSLKSRGHLNNQRMEFLGDRILGFVISDYLFKAYPNWREGTLALNLNSLVCREACAEIAEKIELGKSLIMGKSESKYGGRTKKAILADAMEALIAAIYLDSNMNTVSNVLVTLWKAKLNNLSEVELDPKTMLQHWVQARGMGLPQYIDMKRDGLDHEPIFYVEVRIGNGLSAIGKEKSKRSAQQIAAKDLLIQLEKEI